MRAAQASVCVVVLLVAACTTAPRSAIPPSQLVGFLKEGLEPETQDALAARAERDATLAGWLEGNGPPDYVLLDSPRSATLFYVDLDLEVRFERPYWSEASPEPTSGPIRAHHHRFFSNTDRQRLGDLRREQAQEEQRAARRRSRDEIERLWRPAPAAPADD